MKHIFLLIILVYSVIISKSGFAQEFNWPLNNNSWPDVVTSCYGPRTTSEG